VAIPEQGRKELRFGAYNQKEKKEHGLGSLYINNTSHGKSKNKLPKNKKAKGGKEKPRKKKNKMVFHTTSKQKPGSHHGAATSWAFLETEGFEPEQGYSRPIGSFSGGGGKSWNLLKK